MSHQSILSVPEPGNQEPVWFPGLGGVEIWPINNTV